MSAYWKWPTNSKKAHVFIDGRSLCGQWFVFSDTNSDAVTETDTCSKDDCSTCFKRAQKRGFIATKAVTS